MAHLRCQNCLHMFHESELIDYHKYEEDDLVVYDFVCPRCHESSYQEVNLNNFKL